MTIDEFELLSYAQKDEEILNHGKYLISYDQGIIMCDVYQLSNFFVKFTYDFNKKGEATIKAFTNGDDLQLFQEHFSK